MEQNFALMKVPNVCGTIVALVFCEYLIAKKHSPDPQKLPLLVAWALFTRQLNSLLISSAEIDDHGT
jgi:hypothetical protein